MSLIIGWQEESLEACAGNLPSITYVRLLLIQDNRPCDRLGNLLPRDLRCFRTLSPLKPLSPTYSIFLLYM